jgi:transposase
MGEVFMSSEIFVGIDVSKSMLDYTWLPDGKAFQTTNNSAGIASLIKQLLAIKPSIIIIEATGGYELTLLKGLQQAALPVKLINPRQVRDFARSLNLLGKTDKLDALLLARFAQSRKLIPDQPKDLEREELACLLKRREQLIAMITMEKGRLEQAIMILSKIF